MHQNIAINLANVRANIRQAAEISNRREEEITLLAVTKTVGSNEIKTLLELGVNHLGESRVQSAAKKFSEIADPRITWHMIGHLQRNKVKQAKEIFSVFHSVDSLRLARELNKHSETNAAATQIFLQVNVSGEKSKYGFSKEGFLAFLPQLRELEYLQVRGLMTMAPFTQEKEICRACFRQTRELLQTLQDQGYESATELSMGMTQDYQVAIEEGATIVRIGSALFR